MNRRAILDAESDQRISIMTSSTELPDTTSLGFFQPRRDYFVPGEYELVALHDHGDTHSRLETTNGHLFRDVLLVQWRYLEEGHLGGLD